MQKELKEVFEQRKKKSYVGTTKSIPEDKAQNRQERKTNKIDDPSSNNN